MATPRLWTDASCVNTVIDPSAMIDPMSGAWWTHLAANSDFFNNFCFPNGSALVSGNAGSPLYHANSGTVQKVVNISPDFVAVPGHYGATSITLPLDPSWVVSSPDGQMSIYCDEPISAGGYMYNTGDLISFQGMNPSGLTALSVEVHNTITEDGSYFDLNAIADLNVYFGTITKEDIDAVYLGDATMIRHALRIITPVNSSDWRFPTNRSDGSDPDGPPTGALMRLDPTLDLSGFSLSTWGMIIALTLQYYGAYIGDSGDSGGISLESTLDGTDYAITPDGSLTSDLIAHMDFIDPSSVPSGGAGPSGGGGGSPRAVVSLGIIGSASGTDVDTLTIPITTSVPRSDPALGASIVMVYMFGGSTDSDSHLPPISIGDDAETDSYYSTHIFADGLNHYDTFAYMSAVSDLDGDVVKETAARMGLILNPLVADENNIIITLDGTIGEIFAVAVAYTGCNVNTNYAEGNWPAISPSAKPTDNGFMNQEPSPPAAESAFPNPNCPYSTMEPYDSFDTTSRIYALGSGAAPNVPFDTSGDIGQPQLTSPYDVDPDEDENGFQIDDGNICLGMWAVHTLPADDTYPVTGWDHWNGSFTTLYTGITSDDTPLLFVLGEQAIVTPVQNVDLSGVCTINPSIGTGANPFRTDGVIIGLKAGPGPTWPAFAPGSDVAVPCFNNELKLN